MVLNVTNRLSQNRCSSSELSPAPGPSSVVMSPADQSPTHSGSTILPVSDHIPKNEDE